MASWDASNGTRNSNSNAIKKDEACDKPTSNASEKARWPKWTDLNHQGLVANLTSQSAEVQEVARAMIGATTESIIFDEAYPNEDERIRNLRKMMKDIAISFSYHDIAKRVEREKNYFTILSTIVRGTPVTSPSLCSTLIAQQAYQQSQFKYENIR